jgi:hypothetical protein
VIAKPFEIDTLLTEIAAVLAQPPRQNRRRSAGRG